MGKGGSALSSWLKEFTALVFTQTIQAFIYAMVITIILFGVSSTNTEGLSPNDNNTALGLMSTFALLSVFKVEDLARKIFGIGDTKAGRKGAIKSLAKTAIAAKLGKRVLNNAGKITGGVRAVNKSRQDRYKQKQRLVEDMEDNGYKLEEGSSGKYTAKYVGKNKNEVLAKLGTASSDISQVLENENNEITNSLANSGKSTDTTNTNGANTQVNKAISDASRRRVRNALRNYEDKLSEIDKAKEQGVKDILSGITESITAGVGGVAGGLIGGADGDIDELLQGIVAGAGIGDIVGKNAIEVGDKFRNFAKRNINRKPGISSAELKRTIKAYEEANKSQNVYHGIDIDEI